MVILNSSKYNELVYQIDYLKDRVTSQEKVTDNLYRSLRSLYNHLELEEQIRPEMRVVVKKKEQSF